MGVKYVKDFSFPSAGGFHSGSVQRYAKGGHVTKLPAKAKDSAKGMPARAKPNAPARGAPKMESKPKVGKGQGYEKGGYVPGKEKDVLPVKRPPGRGKDLAPARRFKGKYEGYAEGGPVAELDAGQPDYVAPKPRYEDLLEALPIPEIYDMAPKQMYSEEYDRPQLPPELLNQVYDGLPQRYESAPRENVGQPVGALTPLPEEPNYGGMTAKIHSPLVPHSKRLPAPIEPSGSGDGGGGSSSSGGLAGLFGGYSPRAAEPVDRVGNRRAMMGDRRDMAMRPGMRGVARRAAPARMRAPVPVRQPAMLPFELQPEPLVPIFKKGGAVKGEKIAKVMREYKEGKLHSGSKKGPVVKNPKQAMAIALSEARAAKKAKGGEIFSDEYMAYESKGPKTRYTAAKGRRMAKERAMERRALDKARHAEKYAPGLSLDMEDESTVPTYQSLKPRKKVEMLKYAKGGKAKHSDVKMDKEMVKKAVHKHEKAMHPGKKMTKLNKGGVPSYGRKPMYGGGKC